MLKLMFIKTNADFDTNHILSLYLFSRQKNYYIDEIDAHDVIIQLVAHNEKEIIRNLKEMKFSDYLKALHDYEATLLDKENPSKIAYLLMKKVLSNLKHNQKFQLKPKVITHEEFKKIIQNANIVIPESLPFFIYPKSISAEYDFYDFHFCVFSYDEKESKYLTKYDFEKVFNKKGKTIEVTISRHNNYGYYVYKSSDKPKLNFEVDEKDFKDEIYEIKKLQFHLSLSHFSREDYDFEEFKKGANIIRNKIAMPKKNMGKIFP